MRRVCFTISTEELRFYDVISKRLLVEEGVYPIFAGPSSAVQALMREVFVPGETIGTRSLTERIAADHYDTCENIELREGKFGFTAACVKEKNVPAVLTYGDFLYEGEEGWAMFYLRCKQEGSLTVWINGEEAGSFCGDTSDYDAVPQFYPDQRSKDEAVVRRSMQVPIFTQVRIPLKKSVLQASTVFELKLQITGDIELCYFKLEDC